FFAAALPVQSLLRQLQLERARQRLRAGLLFLRHGGKITIPFRKTKCNLIAGNSWPTSCQWFCFWLCSGFANSSRPAAKYFSFVLLSSFRWWKKFSGAVSYFALLSTNISSEFHLANLTGSLSPS